MTLRTSEITYVRDTIAAKATPPGTGGIGVVRVSGPDAADIGQSLLGCLPAVRYATLCNFLDETGSSIDHGIALYFKGPNSFTGEDVLEVQGHGGPVVLDMILNRIVSLGARIAQPGEFSQRAFLNDKIDLTQAEAIADLINSSTQSAARSAVRSLQGEFSIRINALIALVIELRVFVEAAIDFPEEEVDFLSDERIFKRLSEARQQIDVVLKEAGQGVIMSEGATVVLAGRPNVGKSSLMNILTGRDRSIVTDVPGTTRDIIDELIQIDGIPLRLVDTAGMRISQDKIEAEGVRRAGAEIKNADLTLLVIDANLTRLDRAVQLAELNQEMRLLTGQENVNALIVLNKIDLIEGNAAELGESFQDAVCVSAKTGDGMDQLKERLKRQIGIDSSVETNFTARTRHVVALGRAAAALAVGQQALELHQAGEILAEELRVCQQHLSEITGVFTADDLLGEIFSSFCIGK